MGGLEMSIIAVLVVFGILLAIIATLLLGLLISIMPDIIYSFKETIKELSGKDKCQ
jgi:uncharacterized membrane protein YedE/YeeE